MLRLAEAGVQTTVLERGFRWPVDNKRQIFSSDLITDERSFCIRDKTNIVVLGELPIDNFGGTFDVFETEHLNILVFPTKSSHSI